MQFAYLSKVKQSVKKYTTHIPGKWLIFWHSCNSLKSSAFICFPQVPPHSEQVFLISLNPELVTTFLTTAGVILDNFHLKSFLSSAGKSLYIRRRRYSGQALSLIDSKNFNFIINSINYFS